MFIISTDNLNYRDINKLTIRRIKSLEKLITNKKYHYEEQDRFLLLILGNMNARLNTIFILLNSNNTDGIFPLIRTVYEMNIAFKVYLKSDEKQKFMDAYKNKKGFETSRKLKRYFVNSTTVDINADELSKLKYFAKEYKDEVEKLNKKNQSKTWFELVSKKDIYTLSKELENVEHFFLNYALTSDWVHPQKMDENISNEYEPYLSEYNEKNLILALLNSLNYLDVNMSLLAKHLKLVESNQLYTYGKIIMDLKLALKKEYEKIELSKF